MVVYSNTITLTNCESTLWYSWNTAKVGVKHQPNNQPILKCNTFPCWLILPEVTILKWSWCPTIDRMSTIDRNTTVIHVRLVSRDRVTRSLLLYVCFVYRGLSFCTCSFGHCVVCSSSIYGFWLPLWYLQTLLDKEINQNIYHSYALFARVWN